MAEYFSLYKSTKVHSRITFFTMGIDLRTFRKTNVLDFEVFQLPDFYAAMYLK